MPWDPDLTYEDDLPPELNDFALPHACQVAATLHITSNLLKDVTGKLKHWPTFWPQLKLLEALREFALLADWY